MDFSGEVIVLEVMVLWHSFLLGSPTGPQGAQGLPRSLWAAPLSLGRKFLVQAGWSFAQS